jgi:hypothetical protein
MKASETRPGSSSGMKVEKECGLPVIFLAFIPLISEHAIV